MLLWCTGKQWMTSAENSSCVEGLAVVYRETMDDFSALRADGIVFLLWCTGKQWMTSAFQGFNARRRGLWCTGKQWMTSAKIFCPSRASSCGVPGNNG